MAKTATPKKVTKPSIAQNTPSKASKSKDTSIDKDLLFLWSCCQASNVQVSTTLCPHAMKDSFPDVFYSQFDFAAVANELGIKLNAARMRYTRLKNKIEAVEIEIQKGAAKTEVEDNNHEGEGEGDEQDQVKEKLEENSNDQVTVKEELKDDEAAPL
jgi:hypothetical protein